MGRVSPPETSDDDREDQALLERGEVGRVLARHHHNLVQRARAKLHPHCLDDVDDVVQDAELRLVRQLAVGLPRGMPARACLHKYLDWAVIDLLRSGGRDRERWGLLLDLDAQDHLGRDGVPSAAHLTLVQVLQTWAGQDGHVARALWLEGLSPADVAARLGMLPNAVHQATSRIRRRLLEEGLNEC